MEINPFEQTFLFISLTIRFTLSSIRHSPLLKYFFEVAAFYGTFVGICSDCRMAFLLVYSRRHLLELV
jgi:hypothetical protein